MDRRFLPWAILLVSFTIKTTNSIFVPMRPIYEATGEIIPLLGNPLGGGSPEIVKRNTMVHVSNQRKIYNQEMSQRMKAQRLQMRSLEPQDSYLKAYHEQHEQFHLDLEQKMLEQMNRNNSKPLDVIKNSTTPVNQSKFKKDRGILNPNQINRKDEIKLDRNPFLQDMQNIRNKRLDIDHIEEKTDKEASEKTARSVEYAPGYFLPMQHHQVKVSQNDYETSRGLKYENPKVVYYTPVEKFSAEDVSALTSAALKGQNDHTHYSQLAGYNVFGGDIESSLTSLIGKQPDDQLKGLTYLLQQNNANHKVTNADLKNTHINLKASALDVPAEFYERYEYKSPNSSPLNSYQEYAYEGHTRDHTPITEHVDDVVDPRPPPPRLVPLPATYKYQTDSPATSSNYYKVEVASQVHSTGPKSSLRRPTPNYSYTSGHDNLHYASQYEFGYRVRDPHTGNDYGHSEVSNGHSAAGSYHVLLPDGRLQKVLYRAGPEGFNAEVTYH